jgi:hypothetical protein
VIETSNYAALNQGSSATVAWSCHAVEQCAGVTATHLTACSRLTRVGAHITEAPTRHRSAYALTGQSAYSLRWPLEVRHNMKHKCLECLNSQQFLLATKRTVIGVKQTMICWHKLMSFIKQIIQHSTGPVLSWLVMIRIIHTCQDNTDYTPTAAAAAEDDIRGPESQHPPTAALQGAAMLMLGPLKRPDVRITEASTLRQANQHHSTALAARCQAQYETCVVEVKFNNPTKEAV